MRIITHNDRESLTAAFRTYIKEMSGLRRPDEAYAASLDRALEQGITVDELLNPGNYGRANAVVPQPDCETYVTLMTTSAIIVRPLKSDLGWDSNENILLISQCVRDFFSARHKGGGAWTTESATSSLRRLIRRNSLQGILDDALISRVEEKGPYGPTTNVFQYIQTLLWRQEDFGIENGLTEEQATRRDILDADIPENPEKESGGEEEHEPVSVSGESIPAQLYDKAIHGPEYPDYPEETEEAEAEEQGVQPDMYEEAQEDGAYVSMYTPDNYKMTRVREVFMMLSLKELASIFTLSENDVTLDHFITELASGHINTADESVEARQTHQYINEMLYPSYRECLDYQGVSTSDATSVDFLTASWDMRDSDTRRLQKLRDLIFSAGAADDEDIMSIMRDIELKFRK